MAERKGGLGRGLAALIPTGPATMPEVPRVSPVAPVTSLRPASAEPAPEVAEDQPAAGGAMLRLIDPSAVVPNPKQPRTAFDEEALAELEHSIREFGLLQPIVVRELDPRLATSW